MASTKSKDTPAPSAVKDAEPAMPGLVHAVALGDDDPPRVQPGLMYVMDYAGARRLDAAHAEQRRLAKEDEDLGQRQRVRETYAVGLEPAWLGHAKGRYKTLGLCIEVLSHQPAVMNWKASPDVRIAAENLVKEFVQGTGHQIEGLERRWFLEQVDCVANRKEYCEPLKAADQTAVETALLDVLEVLFGSDRVEPLRMDDSFKRDIKGLLEAWPRQKFANEESKYALAAKVWARLGGVRLSDKAMKEFWFKTRRKRRDR